MDERFWLSPNVTWQTVRDTGKDNVLKPVPSHFLYVAVMTLALLVLRHFFERYCYIAKSTSVKESGHRCVVYVVVCLH